MVLVMVLLGGCADMRVNRTTLVVSTMAIAVDYAQTREMVSRGWEEQNPMLGSRPNEAAIACYFFSAAALNAMAWLLVPDRWKSVIPLGVIGTQAVTIHGNSALGARMF